MCLRVFNERILVNFHKGPSDMGKFNIKENIFPFSQVYFDKIRRHRKMIRLIEKRRNLLSGIYVPAFGRGRAVRRGPLFLTSLFLF